jgi:large subunit ribosomal protein L17
MRHNKKGKKFGRLRGDRISFLRNLSNDLIRTGKIDTTDARAKAIRPQVEKLVTMAKRQTLAGRRVLLSRVQSSAVVNKLYHDLGPRYAERNGGYLRITKLQTTKKRDGSKMARIEFV